MKFTIQHNMPISSSRDIVISFAQLFSNADFSELRKLLMDDITIVIYNRECVKGVDAVLEYFKDWQIRVGDTFDCEVRWSAQFSQPEIYFTSDKINQAYILDIQDSNR